MTAELAELVGQQARRALAAVRDPRAKAVRRRRRARRAAELHSGIALIAGAVTAVIGSTEALELSEVAAGSVTALAVLGAGTAGVRLVRLHRSPLLPAQELPPALPPRGSAARAPLIRLAEAEAGFAELLAVHGVAVVGLEALESAKAALAQAAAELRGTAETIRAVERAAGAATSDKSTAQRAGLLDAVAALRSQLDEGVTEVCGLVTAAGAVVAAARPETRPAALTEATDRLTGLAEGLRELRLPGSGG
ncbi:MAG: phage shock envelope stress response protein PspM [Pseudonocardiaceae bacterium]